MKIIYEPAGRAREYSPMAANLYENCSHACFYCFNRRFAKGDFKQGRTRVNVIEDLKKDCANLPEKMYPVLLCFLCDPYQECAGDTTREAIAVLKKAGLSVQILSKAGESAMRDFDLLDSTDYVAASLTFIDPKKSRKNEPGAALPENRFQYLREAKARGFHTWASLEPVIEVEETMQIIQETKEFVDLYRLGVLNYHEPPKRINWTSYGVRVVTQLNFNKKGYQIKDDLKKHLKGYEHLFQETEFEGIKNPIITRARPRQTGLF
jgi:DNA repair photolyase